MLRIGICEDDNSIKEQLHDMIVKILFAYEDVEFQYFADGEDVISSIKEGEFYLDLLFLDIHMKILDGMKTADFIRKHQIDVDIMFLTVSEKHVFEGYTYKAFAYCLKPLKRENIEKALLRYIEEKEKCPECFNVNVKGKEIRIPLDRIIYFESSKRKVIAHTITDDVEFYSKLNDVEKMVKGKGFIRCHQSYMVNGSMIDSKGRTEIIVQGIPIPMSRKYYEGLDEEEEQERMRVTKSLAINQEKTGALVFVKGKLIGAIMRINPDKTIKIGRDGAQSDIVINVPGVSRLHCSIIYNSEQNDYIICDCSKNGLYRGDGQRLSKGEPIHVKPGEEIWICNEENVFRLG